jgi:hypothetical protein
MGNIRAATLEVRPLCLIRARERPRPWRALNMPALAATTMKTGDDG